MKKWWFPILMFAFAIVITLFTVLDYNFMRNGDGLIYSLLIINFTSSALLLFIIGVDNKPKKEK
jgi:hypothetical protein